MSRRTLSLTLASLLSLAITAGAIWLGLRSRENTTGSTPDDLIIEAIPDPKTVNQLQLSLEFQDPDDPTRVQYRVDIDRTLPKPGGLYELTKPRATIFLEDGSTLLVSADRGEVQTELDPDAEGMSSPPERGVLSGDVDLRLFDAGIDPDELDGVHPRMRAKMDSIQFDTILGELRTNPNDIVRVSWFDAIAPTDPVVVFLGRGLMIRGSEVRERLELLEIARGGIARYSPRPEATDSDETDASTPPPGDRAVAAAPAPATPPPANPATPASPPPVVAVSEPKVELYRAVFLDDVIVKQPAYGRSLESDQLELWARLHDNKLPDDAITPIRLGEVARNTDHKPSPISTPAAVVATTLAVQDDAPDAQVVPDQPVSAAASIAEEQLTLPRVSDEDIFVSWDGRLVITPLATTPAELRDEHASARFSGLEDRQILLSDERTGAKVTSSWLSYGATTATVALGGTPAVAGSDATGVAANVPDVGGLVAPALTANLSTGEAEIPGPGAVRAKPPTDAEETADRRIEWTDIANFTLEQDTTGALTGGIRNGAFFGEVLATDGNATLEGDVVDATFARSKTQDLRLSHLRVRGDVQTDGGHRKNKPDRRVGQLIAEELDVAFDPDAPGEEPTPTFLVARGDVQAGRRNESIYASHLEVGLTRLADEEGELGDIITTNVLARDDIFVQLRNGATVRADELRADTQNQTSVILGEDATISRKGVSIVGRQMEVNGETKELFVFGEGVFSYDGETKGGQPIDLTTTWSESMRFSDSEGIADCIGNVVATSAPDDLSEDVVNAYRVILRFDTSEDDGSESDVETVGVDPSLSEFGLDRPLTTAEAIGESIEVIDGEPARVETRRYIVDAFSGERTLERFARVMAGRFVADNNTGILRIPGAGKAAFYDGRTDAGQEESTNDAEWLDGGSMRGSSMFTWGESLEVERATGRLVMDRNVRMVHRPLERERGEPAPRFFLECESMEAFFDGLEGGAADLRSVIAREAVYAKSDRPDQTGTRELIADEVRYDAKTGIAEAVANPGSRITLFDSERVTPVIAGSMTWDLIEDAIEVRELMPVTVPY